MIHLSDAKNPLYIIISFSEEFTLNVLNLVNHQNLSLIKSNNENPIKL